jgi:hypothetical protein
MDGELMGKKKKHCRSGSSSHEPGLMEMLNSHSSDDQPGLSTMFGSGKTPNSMKEFHEAGSGLRMMTDAAGKAYEKYKKR